MLAALLTTTGRHGQTAPVACRVLMDARTLAACIPAIGARVQAAQDRAQAGWEQVIRTGVEVGEWPPGTDGALQAQVGGAAMHGLMTTWHLAPGSFDWEAGAAVLAEIGQPLEHWLGRKAGLGPPAIPGARRPHQCG